MNGVLKNIKKTARLVKRGIPKSDVYGDLETHDQRNPQSIELWKVCDGVFGDHPVEVTVLLQTRKIIISLWISTLFHQ